MKTLISLLLILISVSLPFAAIIRVPADYPTIQMAVDSSRSGDEIIIDPGVYPPVYMRHKHYLTISGAGIFEPNITTIDGNNNTRGFQADSCSKILLQGLEIRNCFQECLHFRYSREIYIYDNYLHDCWDALGNSLAITCCEYVIVKRNIIIRSYEHSLYIDALYNSPTGRWSRYISIVNNTIGFTGLGTVGGSGLVQSWSDTNFMYVNNINVVNSDYSVWYKFGGQSGTERLMYNDHYGNGYGPWGRCNPGAYDTTNIYVDPQFVGGTGAEAYRLQETSPCIDAGDPILLDPDSTRSDIGALYYDQGNPGELSIIVTSLGNTRIPYYGGNLRFNVTIENTSTLIDVFSAWGAVRLPRNLTFSPIFLFLDIYLPQGTISRDLSLRIPGWVPSGQCFLIGYVGTYPNYIADLDSFSFTKERNDGFESMGFEMNGGGDFELGDDSGWFSPGNDDEYHPCETNLKSAQSSLTLSASPNPFNTQSTITFRLPGAGAASIKAFDIAGREVADLMDDDCLQVAGALVWNAGNLTSGIYFIRIAYENESLIHRVLLIK